MSFNEDLITMTRVNLGLIGDESVSDETLLSTIYTAAFFVKSECAFSYTVDVTNETITPEPDDVNFSVLTSYKASELYCQGLLRADTLSSGVTVKLGPSSVSKRDSKATADLVRKFATEYREAKIDYLTSIAGDAICGPATLPGAGLP